MKHISKINGLEYEIGTIVDPSTYASYDITTILDFNFFNGE